MVPILLRRVAIAAVSIPFFMAIKGCISEGSRYVYLHATFPETATPLSGANTVYDDFNSAPPPTVVTQIFPFSFSSNRSTQGGTYDIETAEITLSVDQRTGSYSLDAQMKAISDWADANSPANEFGPSTFHSSTNMDWADMFASDRNGNLDIYYSKGTPVLPATAINSNFDEAYPTAGPDGNLYFSSNRSGNWKIYVASVPQTSDFPTFLSGSSASITSVDAVNGTGDDRAPYIRGNLMVFASNRPGGYGGYDLWYSTYDPGLNKWSPPANFGPKINSSSDEFRPAVTAREENELMFFSSNRPGGMGGYDLYYVGIPSMTGPVWNY